MDYKKYAEEFWKRHIECSTGRDPAWKALAAELMSKPEAERMEILIGTIVGLLCRDMVRCHEEEQQERLELLMARRAGAIQ